MDITEVDEKTVLHNEKIEKYRHQLQDYNPEVRQWLVQIYSDYGKHIHRNIGNLLKQNEFFFIYNSDSEFRSLSYDCYAKLIKTMPFLRDQTEMLFQFIKEYHRILSQRNHIDDFPFISDQINEWLDMTWAKNNVSLTAFAYYWAERFLDNKDSWPATHRKKSNDPYFKYEYDHKQKSNLFNLDSMYRRIPKKSFTKGKKQEFEIILMYFWLHSINGDEDGYWQDYLEKVFPSLN